MGPLADPHDARMAVLRRTLSVYFAAGQNAIAAAARIGVNDRTVAYRLRTIEERVLGEPIAARRDELALALRLRAHLSVVAQQLDVATVWLLEWRFLTGEPLEKFLAERHRYERRVAKLFRDAVAAGALRADLDVRRAALAFFSLGNWAYTWLTPRTDVAAAADAFWALLHDGMAAR